MPYKAEVYFKTKQNKTNQKQLLFHKKYFNKSNLGLNDSPRNLNPLWVNLQNFLLSLSEEKE